MVHPSDTAGPADVPGSPSDRDALPVRRGYVLMPLCLHSVATYAGPRSEGHSSIDRSARLTDKKFMYYIGISNHNASSQL